jgi:hypothetical protein
MRTRITLAACTIILFTAASDSTGAGAFLTYQDASDADSGYGISLKLAQVRQFGLRIRKIKPVQPTTSAESFENLQSESVSRPSVGM